MSDLRTRIVDYLEKGLDCFGLGQTEAARSYWKKVLELDPSNTQAQEYLHFLAPEKDGPTTPPLPMTAQITPFPQEGIHIQVAPSVLTPPSASSASTPQDDPLLSDIALPSSESLSAPDFEGGDAMWLPGDDFFEEDDEDEDDEDDDPTILSTFSYTDAILQGDHKWKGGPNELELELPMEADQSRPGRRVLAPPTGGADAWSPSAPMATPQPRAGTQHQPSKTPETNHFAGGPIAPPQSEHSARNVKRWSPQPNTAPNTPYASEVTNAQGHKTSFRASSPLHPPKQTPPLLGTHTHQDQPIQSPGTPLPQTRQQHHMPSRHTQGIQAPQGFRFQETPQRSHVSRSPEQQHYSRPPTANPQGTGSAPLHNPSAYMATPQHQSQTPSAQSHQSNVPPSYNPAPSQPPRSHAPPSSAPPSHALPQQPQHQRLVQAPTAPVPAYHSPQRKQGGDSAPSLSSFPSHTPKPAPVTPQAITPLAPASVQEPEEDESELLLSGAVELKQAGDLAGAMELLVLVLKTAPDHDRAKQIKAECQEQLHQSYRKHLQAPQSKPSLSVAVSELNDLHIDHRGGFILSQLDGTTSIEDIVMITGFNEFEVLEFLHQMLEKNYIQIH